MLVPFDDPAALAEAVNGLLDDPKRLERARAEARVVGGSWRGPRSAGRRRAARGGRAWTNRVSPASAAGHLRRGRAPRT